MNKIERVTAVLEGRRPDRTPVSFWCHFAPDCAFGAKAVDAHVRHVETYDVDFLKIMDDNRYPRLGLPDGVISDAADLDRLTALRGDEDTFGRQLELVGALARRYAGEMRLATTVFNPWTTVRNMTAPDPGGYTPPSLEKKADPCEVVMARFVREAPQALARALDVVTESTVRFVQHCLAAGAQGIYMSVRDDWVDTPENGLGTYDRLARPGDLATLAAASRGTFNILHVCGTALHFARFADYPVHVLHWADRLGGPSIAEVSPWARPALCAGVDNLRTMVTGSPDDCARQVVDAIQEASPRPILVAPGCTYDPAAVPAANLHAIRRAVEEPVTGSIPCDTAG